MADDRAIDGMIEIITRALTVHARELRESVGTPDLHVLVVTYDAATRKLSWGSIASGPWPGILRQVAEEYERGFPKDCGLDEAREPAESAFDEN